MPWKASAETEARDHDGRISYSLAFLVRWRRACRLTRL